MVRAGENAFLFDDFKDSNLVSIGWEVGDLSDKSSDEIKEIMLEKYSNSNNKGLGINIGQVIRFVCEFEVGDYVITYNPETRLYLVGKITSDYYYSDKLAKKYNLNDSYCHCRDVEWLGTTKRDDLSSNSLNSLGSVLTIFNIKDSIKNDILTKLDNDKIEWTDFYMEFADKLLEFKDNRNDLIGKIITIYENININLATLDRDNDGNKIMPVDIDPFTVFGLFNKQITDENRIRIINGIKKEFSISADVPINFYGIPVLNNMMASFYYYGNKRGENDIDNLWKLFEYSIELVDGENVRNSFISTFDEVIKQKGVRWNITMALFWIRPYYFISLDENSRIYLSEVSYFSQNLKNDIKSLKSPPSGLKYLQICEDITSSLKDTTFLELSHNAYVSNKSGDDSASDEGIGDGNIKSIKYWLISPGEGARLWDEFYKEGIIGIGMDGTGDLSQYQNKDELKLKFQEIFNDKSSHMHDVHASWQFVHEMQIGDIIFVKQGMGKIIGRGIIESEYEYNPSKSYHNIRKVKWTNKGNWPYNYAKLPMKTLTDITNLNEMRNNISELISGEEIIDEPKEDSYLKYSSEDFLEEVYINEDDYDILVKLLKHKKNLIVEGAPGVGKTYLAKRLAYSIMGEKDFNRVMMVQFHQSYSYEDFVMGYRPINDGFKLKHGSFYNFCKKAEIDDENDYFFIIDEINRGNLSKIFGELFMLIENDKRGDKNKIQLLYSDELFFIPKNVHIIGLMNTADRSLAMIDYALRRRFAFFDLKPGFSSDGFVSYQNELNDERFDNLVLALKELNEEIKNDESLGEGFRIGHSYLSNLKDCENLDFIVEYELIPLLREYWFDEPDKVRYWSDKLRSVVN